MKRNMSKFDRAVRLLLMVAIGILYMNGVITGLVAIILTVVAGILLVTSLFRFCPLYGILGMKTIGRKDC